MVTLDESRSYAVNYFGFVADSQAAKRIADNKNKAEGNFDSVEPDATAYEFKSPLLDYYVQMLEQYILELSSGFNLLLYGYGRKFELLEFIHRKVKSVIIDVYKLESLQQVYSVFLENGINLKSQDYQPPQKLFILHGLDCHKVRNELFYRLLVEAVCSNALKLVVTIEDPSFPFLLTPKQLQVFKFVHHDCTTFTPYTLEELSGLPDLFSSKSSNKRSIKGALFVLQSVTPNARSMFKLLAEQQMSKCPEHVTPDDSDSEAEELSDGLSLQEFFRHAQSKFLISNEASFKIILNEFTDHELVKISKHPTNGLDCLRIPFSHSNIKDLLSML